MVSIPQAVSTVATLTLASSKEAILSTVSIPQAVSTVATIGNVIADTIAKVSIPQAVSTVATPKY